MTPSDLTLGALLGQALESITDADGRVFRTFATLCRRPGELTAAYLRGERKRYVGPVQLFVLVNVLFFFVQAALGFHILSNDLGSHLEEQRYSNWVGPFAERVLAERGTTRADYAPVFDSAVAVNAKALAFMMVPMFALLALVLSPFSGRPLVAHMVFGLHFEAFLLLALAVPLPLIGVPVVAAMELAGKQAYADVVVAWLLIALCAVYAYFAFGRVYGGAVSARLAKAALFAVLMIGVIRVYRLIVFFVTFYTA
ncbi:MAG TPA: DUF3667 domain-containing protein [Gammaproteobacteria bacterium]|nr:DUF3667 domain-containing protein [Gammaproteobacteria bacterium]